MIFAGVVDICLIPEVDFSEDKLMAYIGKLLERKGHTVNSLLVYLYSSLSLLTRTLIPSTNHTFQQS